MSGASATPVAITRPKPVRRAIASAISPVCASDVLSGAATTTPGRPARAAMWPSGRATTLPGPSRRVSVAIQPERIRGPAATLTRTRRNRGGRLIIDEHRLRQRVLAIMRERQQHAAAAARQRQLARAAVKHERGRLTALAAHFQLA